MAGWNLFEEMDMLRREIDQVFRGYGKGTLNPSFLPGIGTGEYPRVNLAEDEQNYYLDALVPGIDPKDLDLNVMQGTLTLSGERKDAKTEGQTWHRRERGAGKFMRTIEIPESVDVTRIDAEYCHGVLQITLPKKAQQQPKKISVRAS